MICIVKVMQEKTRLLVLTGVHGNLDGKLGGKDDRFFKSSENQVRILKRRMEADIEEKKIEFRVEDVGQIDISERGTRELDEEKFVEAVKNFQPTVLVLAFCFSQKLELNNLLRAPWYLFH